MTDPVPAETLNRVLWAIPNVLCLIGSRHGDEWNGMTQSWVTQVSMEPVLVGAAIDTDSVTNRLVAASGVFTVNLWPRHDTRPFVKFSKPAVKDGMTLNGRPIREGVTGAPVFTEAAAFLECTVWRAVPCGSHDLFLGEVVAAGFGEEGDGVAVARVEDTRMKYGGVRRPGHLAAGGQS